MRERAVLVLAPPLRDGGRVDVLVMGMVARVYAVLATDAEDEFSELAKVLWDGLLRSLRPRVDR